MKPNPNCEKCGGEGIIHEDDRQIAGEITGGSSYDCSCVKTEED